MVNMYKVKFLGAMLAMAFVPTLVFFGILLAKGFWFALIFYLLAIGVMWLVVQRFVRHPLLNFLFGEGVLTFIYDSKGIVFPVLSKLTADSVEIVTEQGVDNAPFDRDCIVYVSEPIKEGKLLKGKIEEKGKEKDVQILVFPEEAWKYRFSFMTFPAFLYNQNLGMFLTKDWLGEQEKTVFRKHALLEFLHKIKDLSKYLRDFARYVITAMEVKKEPIWKKIPLWVIALIIIILLVGYFVFAGNLQGTVAGAIGGAVGGNPIQPR